VESEGRQIDEAVLNTVHIKNRKNPPVKFKIMNVKNHAKREKKLFFFITDE
jgi:hypothetical protein